MKAIITAALLVTAALFLAQASDPGIRRLADVGRDAGRNMVSNQKVVTSWDVKTGKNVKWVAQTRFARPTGIRRSQRRCSSAPTIELVRDPPATVGFP